MNVPSILTAVLTTAPTPLDPIYAAVEQDTVWLLTGTLVKVYLYYMTSNVLCTLACHHSTHLQILMNVSLILTAVLTTATTLLDLIHVAVEWDSVWLPTGTHVKV